MLCVLEICPGLNIAHKNTGRSRTEGSKAQLCPSAAVCVCDLRQVPGWCEPVSTAWLMGATSKGCEKIHGDDTKNTWPLASWFLPLTGSSVYLVCVPFVLRIKYFSGS